MKKLWKIYALGILACSFAGLMMNGCKSVPELTRDNALALIQAQYDKQQPESPTILVNDDGMKAGVTAKYWDRSKAYPNNYWADFKLTDTGKKAVKLVKGGDTIEWHPDSAADTHYTIEVSPVAATHLKAMNPSDPQEDMGTKTVQFDEVTSLEGVPDAVQQMARDSSTKVSTRRTATFVLDGGAWKLKSIN